MSIVLEMHSERWAEIITHSVDGLDIRLLILMNYQMTLRDQ
jgi:tRNA threonylcarbamoyladenosine modification (KEOPS) complex  Pcc1 subunit